MQPFKNNKETLVKYFLDSGNCEKMWCHVTDLKPASSENRLKFQCLSMYLQSQRGNSLCVMGTVTHHRNLEEIYN